MPASDFLASRQLRASLSSRWFGRVRRRLLAQNSSFFPNDVEQHLTALQDLTADTEYQLDFDAKLKTKRSINKYLCVRVLSFGDRPVELVSCRDFLGQRFVQFAKAFAQNAYITLQLHLFLLIHQDLLLKLVTFRTEILDACGAVQRNA